MAIPTGRTRTVTASGNFSGTSDIEFHIYSGMGAGPPAWLWNFLKIELEFAGCLIRFLTRRFTFKPSPPQQMYLDLACYTGPGNGVGNSDTDFEVHDFDTGDVDTLHWVEDLSAGTWTISGDFEEVLNVTGGSFPTYGGVAVDDPPY